MTTFREKMKNLIPSLSEDLAYYHIQQDPISGKIAEDFRPELIARSIEVGQTEARKMRSEFPEASPLGIIRQKGLILERKGENNAMQYITMAYFEEPNRIVIYGDNVKKVAELLETNGLDQITNRQLEDIVLAHELFHVVEGEKPLYLSGGNRGDGLCKGTFGLTLRSDDPQLSFYVRLE